MTGPQLAQGRRSRVSEIPVPPYDRELPQSYWQNLQFPKLEKPPPIARARVRRWALALSLLGLSVGALFLISAKTLKQDEFPPPVLDSGDLVTNPPRATLVKSPLTVRRAELVVAQAAQSYWAQMPDGRRIVIHYCGEVADYAHLPVQPVGGANNVAYHTRADGNTWIWTVPVGASNIPQWIDP
jgi:hypothetical protein